MVGGLPLPVLVLSLIVSVGIAPQFALKVRPMFRLVDGHDLDWAGELRLGDLRLGLLMMPVAHRSS